MNQNENKKAGGISALLGLNRTTRAGSYTMAMTLIVLAVLIVINLLVGTLPTSLTKLDSTPNDMYHIPMLKMFTTLFAMAILKI